MTQFDQVTIIKQANIYFDGKVTSRAILFPNGERKTLGIMLPGEYEFGTAAPEIMEILVGKLDVLLPGQSTWRSIAAGQTFDLPANAKFQLRIYEVTDYCCSYVK